MSPFQLPLVLSAWRRIAFSTSMPVIAAPNRVKVDKGAIGPGVLFQGRRRRIPINHTGAEITFGNRMA